MNRRTSRGTGTRSGPSGKPRRSMSPRRTSVPPARQLSGLGGSFKQLLGMLGAAGASLEQSRRPMRRR